VTPAHRPSSHRAPAKLTRRRVLGFASLAAVPAVTYAGLHVRDSGPAAQATPRVAHSASPSAAARPSSVAAAPVVTSGGGPVPFRPGEAMLGAYLDLTGTSLTQALALRRQQLGRTERIVHTFYAWTDALLQGLPSLPAGSIPLVSWRGTTYADILNGSSDDLIAAAARRLAADKKPTMLRWAWEMNGDWYSWGGSKNPERSAGYVTSWQRIHKIFAAEGATNVSWVWSPNWRSSPPETWNEVADYYPGDKYVDWVGMSGYNLHRETPAALFDTIYTQYSTRKPIMITEVGAVDRGGRTKAEWIETFGTWVGDRPGVGAVSWFDTDTHPNYPEKWRIDTDADSLAAFRALATSARFSG
jgi:hypothetical protein